MAFRWDRKGAAGLKCFCLLTKRSPVQKPKAGLQIKSVIMNTARIAGSCASLVLSLEEKMSVHCLQNRRSDAKKTWVLTFIPHISYRPLGNNL